MRRFLKPPTFDGPPLRAKRRALFHRVAFTFAAVALPYTVVFGLVGHLRLGLMMPFVSLGFLGLAWANFRERFDLARMGLIAHACATVSYFFSVLGESAGVQMALIPVACLPALIYERKEKISTVIATALPVGLWFLLEGNLSFKSGYSDTVRFTYVSVGAGVFWLLISLVRHLALISDRAESRLRLSLAERQASEARYRATLDGGMDSFVLLEAERNADGRIVDFWMLDLNAKAEMLGGISRQEVTGKRLTDIFPGKISKEFLSHYIKVVETRQMVEEEIRVDFLKPEIEWIHRQMIPVRDGLAVTSRDVTQQRKLRQQLVESEEKYRLLFSKEGDAILLVDKDSGRILEANEFAEKLYGYAGDEFMSLNERDLQSKHSPAPLTSQDLDDLDFGLMPIRHHRRKDGSRFPVETSTGEFSLRGQVVRCVIVRDVSVRREQERMIAAQQIQIAATAKMSSLGEMAAGIAHEINNPMSIIHGNAYLLREMVEKKNLNEAAVLKAAAKIEDVSMRVGRIIRGLRTFARDGSQDPFEFVKIKNLIEETFELCRERFRNHMVHIDMPKIPDDLILQCRSVQISQVLLNLLLNAHDASVNAKERWIAIGLQQTDRNLELSISDSGPGVPKEIREKIFQPFFTTKEVGKGTGLGLSISRGILETHSGELFLKEGAMHTTFVIRIPLRQDAMRESA